MIGMIFVTLGAAAGAFLESVILSHFFKGESQPTSQGYIGLLTGTLGFEYSRYSNFQNHFNLGEMTASTNPNYSRQTVTWSEPDGDGSIHNEVVVQFSASAGHTDTIDFITIYDSATEATGNILITIFPDNDWNTVLTPDSPLSGGDSYEINPGDLRIGHGTQFLSLTNAWVSKMTPYLQEKMSRKFLMNEDIPAANGQYLGLLTVVPSWDTNFFDGTSITWNPGQEVTSSDYNRTPLSWGEILNISTLPALRNTNKIKIIPNSNWGTLRALGIWDAPSGGNLLIYSILVDSQVREMIPGREINIKSGSIEVSELNTGIGF